jgi:hypothetical protein
MFSYLYYLYSPWTKAYDFRRTNFHTQWEVFTLAIIAFYPFAMVLAKHPNGIFSFSQIGDFYAGDAWPKNFSMMVGANKLARSAAYAFGHKKPLIFLINRRLSGLSELFYVRIW